MDQCFGLVSTQLATFIQQHKFIRGECSTHFYQFSGPCRRARSRVLSEHELTMASTEFLVKSEINKFSVSSFIGFRPIVLPSFNKSKRMPIDIMEKNRNGSQRRVTAEGNGRMNLLHIAGRPTDQPTEFQFRSQINMNHSHRRHRHHHILAITNSNNIASKWVFPSTHNYSQKNSSLLPVPLLLVRLVIFCFGISHGPIPRWIYNINAKNISKL